MYKINVLAELMPYTVLHIQEENKEIQNIKIWDL